MQREDAERLASTLRSTVPQIQVSLREELAWCIEIPLPDGEMAFISDQSAGDVLAQAALTGRFHDEPGFWKWMEAWTRFRSLEDRGIEKGGGE